MSGGINALLAINSAAAGSGNATNGSANAIPIAVASSGSAPSATSGDTTSVIKYPDGSIVTTVRDKAGEVVYITVTSPTLSTGTTAVSAGTVSSGIDVTA